MKQLLVLLCGLLIHTSIFAGKYLKVKIIMRNGTEFSGEATLPENPAPVPILFKEDGMEKR